MRRLRSVLILIFIVALSAGTAAAQNRQRGIASREAPLWNVDTWFNLPHGNPAPEITNLRDKVVYLYCFQSWCPGCHRHGFPTLQKVMGHFGDSSDVAFVPVQTVFEGYSTNTPAAAKRTADRYKLAVPVGHSGSRQQPSGLMQRYITGGTPWTVIIDRHGTVQYNDFHIHPNQAIALIHSLRRARTPQTPVVVTLAASRGGQEVIGQHMPRLRFDRWLNREKTGEKSVMLYQWWTDPHPFNRKGLASLEEIRTVYAAKGLTVVSVFHPTSARALDDEAIVATAKRHRYHGPIAVDETWSQLRRIYPQPRDKQPTTITLLVDTDDVIRFVHPGPALFASNDPKHAQMNQDHRRLKGATESLLAEAAEKQNHRSDADGETHSTERE